MESKIIDLLKKLGLTDSQSQVYLDLLKLGEAKIGDLRKTLDIAPSNLHDACEKLHEKGIISFIQKNNIKYYKPIQPESLQNLIDAKKEQLQEDERKFKELLPRLSVIKKLDTGDIQNAEIFFGVTGLKSAFNKLFSREFVGQDYLFFYKHDKLNVKKVHNFFSKAEIEHLYKKIPTKGIFSKGYQKLFEERKNKIQAKFTNLPIPSNINIYGNKTLMISWSESPIAFLITSKEITQTFEELFNDTWDKL